MATRTYCDSDMSPTGTSPGCMAGTRVMDGPTGQWLVGVSLSEMRAGLRGLQDPTLGWGRACHRRPGRLERLAGLLAGLRLGLLPCDAGACRGAR